MTAKRFQMGYDDGLLRFVKDNVTNTNLDIVDCWTVLNELYEEKEQLLSDKEHLMGCLIRFFGYDDEDIDYNLNRESNQEYGKQYYSMKEETKKELEE